MPQPSVRRVDTESDREQFLTFPWCIYQDDPLWVPPILDERRARIDPQRGHFFQRGEADLFIAWQGDEPVGTIAVGVDRFMNQHKERRDAVFGFFECVDDVSIAEALLQRATAWAGMRELNHLIGPYHLDYEDSYGVLVEGRGRPPAVLCGHTPPYYQVLVEGLGFDKARGDALAYEIQLDSQAASFRRLARLGDYVKRRGRVTIRSADLNDFRAEVDRVFQLINTALQHLPNFIPWQRHALEATMQKFRHVADPELVLFAEVDGQPVGWLPGVPNVNEALIHANGLRTPWDKLRAWWAMRRQPECLAIKSVLVLPEYWDTGVPVLLFAEMARRAQARGYRWADLSLTSEANPTTPLLAKHVGARVYKRYRVYEKAV